MEFLKRVCSAIVPIFLRMLADFVADFFGGDEDEG